MAFASMSRVYVFIVIVMNIFGPGSANKISPMKVIDAPSLLLCASACVDHGDMCLSVRYHEQIGRCKMYSISTAEMPVVETSAKKKVWKAVDKSQMVLNNNRKVSLK